MGAAKRRGTLAQRRANPTGIRNTTGKLRRMYGLLLRPHGVALVDHVRHLMAPKPPTVAKKYQD